MTGFTDILSVYHLIKSVIGIILMTKKFFLPKFFALCFGRRKNDSFLQLFHLFVTGFRPSPDLFDLIHLYIQNIILCSFFKSTSRFREFILAFNLYRRVDLKLHKMQRLRLASNPGPLSTKPS